MFVMAARKLSEKEVETLIQFWHEETRLWDVSSRAYSHQDARKAALQKISENMDIPIHNITVIARGRIGPIYARL